MYTQEKPDLEELAHHGVLGMKWGKTRAKASRSDIMSARTRNKSRTRKIERQESKINTLKGKGQASKKEEKTLATMKSDYLKSPDRVIAARMTRGEKAATIIMGVGVGNVLAPVALPVAVAGVIGTSARSRRIESKQEDGAYGRKKS